MTAILSIPKTKIATILRFAKTKMATIMKIFKNQDDDNSENLKDQDGLNSEDFRNLDSSKFKNFEKQYEDISEHFIDQDGENSDNSKNQYGNNSGDFKDQDGDNSENFKNLYDIDFEKFVDQVGNIGDDSENFEEHDGKNCDKSKIQYGKNSDFLEDGDNSDNFKSQTDDTSDCFKSPDGYKPSNMKNHDDNDSSNFNNDETCDNSSSSSCKDGDKSDSFKSRDDKDYFLNQDGDKLPYCASEDDTWSESYSTCPSNATSSENFELRHQTSKATPENLNSLYTKFKSACRIPRPSQCKNSFSDLTISHHPLLDAYSGEGTGAPRVTKSEEFEKDKIGLAKLSMEGDESLLLNSRVEPWNGNRKWTKPEAIWNSNRKWTKPETIITKQSTSAATAAERDYKRRRNANDHRLSSLKCLRRARSSEVSQVCGLQIRREPVVNYELACSGSNPIELCPFDVSDAGNKFELPSSVDEDQNVVHQEEKEEILAKYADQSFWIPLSIGGVVEACEISTDGSTEECCRNLEAEPEQMRKPTQEISDGNSTKSRYVSSVKSCRSYTVLSVNERTTRTPENNMGSNEIQSSPVKKSNQLLDEKLKNTAGIETRQA